MAKKCALCQENTLALFRRKIADNEVVCEDCIKLATKNLTFKQIARIKNVTADEIRRAIVGSSEVSEKLIGFKPTKTIGKTIQFDDGQEKMLIISPIKSYVLDYKDIRNFELAKDNETIAKSGVSRAIVGGLLFGGTGAIVGAVTGKDKEYCSSLGVVIEVDNTEQPFVYISFINQKTKIESDTYNIACYQAQECMSALQLICNNQEEGVGVECSSQSPIDEIKQFKELLDEGIITQEEFDKKKKELLDL